MLGKTCFATNQPAHLPADLVDVFCWSLCFVKNKWSAQKRTQRKKQNVQIPAHTQRHRHTHIHTHARTHARTRTCTSLLITHRSRSDFIFLLTRQAEDQPRIRNHASAYFPSPDKGGSLPAWFHLKRLGQPLRFGVGMGCGVLFALRFPKCRIDSETISALFFVAVLAPFEVQFWVILGALWCLNFVIKSLTFQSTFPGDPGHRHTAKTSENVGRVV